MVSRNLGLGSTSRKDYPDLLDDLCGLRSARCSVRLRLDLEAVELAIRADDGEGEPTVAVLSLGTALDLAKALFLYCVDLDVAVEGAVRRAECRWR